MGCNLSTARFGSGDIRQTYKIGGILGSGSFGQVRLCTKIATGETYAVKIMAKQPRKKTPKVDLEDMFKNEVAMLQTFDHENVVHFLEFFEDKHFLYAVMEKCSGGELFTKIVRQKKFNEEDASLLARQMLTAIEYVHSLKVVHRDIKAENFLFKEKRDHSLLLLIDFGMATKLESDKQLTQLCGSPHYVAPELIRRQYRFQVDMWALGVMIYLMLFGKYPFEAEDHKTIVQQILKTEPDYSKGSVSPSPMAIDFMKRLLTKNPDKRMNAREALEHEWVSNDMAGENASHSVPEEVIREAHRKSTLDRDELNQSYQHDMDEKLAKLQADYAKLHSAQQTTQDGLAPPHHNRSPTRQKSARRTTSTCSNHMVAGGGDGMGLGARRFEAVAAHAHSRKSSISSTVQNECEVLHSYDETKNGSGNEGAEGVDTEEGCTASTSRRFEFCHSTSPPDDNNNNNNSDHYNNKNDNNNNCYYYSSENDYEQRGEDDGGVCVLVGERGMESAGWSEIDRMSMRPAWHGLLSDRFAHQFVWDENFDYSALGN